VSQGAARVAGVVGALALASAMSLACDGAAKREAASVVAAVDQFRRADNAARPARVEALRALQCSNADVCRARELCLASAEPTGKALSLKAEVEGALARVERGELPPTSPEAKALPGKLDEAQALLDRGHEALGACDDAILALKRTYAIR
jgi:hypothetical protein